MKRLIFAIFFSGLLPIGLHAQGARVLPFQGRLTDSQGQPIADGVKLIQFQIYGDPIGGNALWAGEVHRTTVNGGLVNVMLGSKNPLPNDRPDNPSRSFFDGTLYLQITVDTSGPNGGPDGQITAADPPLLPRQAILPVLYANESGFTRNSQKLNGFDWSALLVSGANSNNPVAGQIDGAKLGPGTLPADRLASGSITSSQIATGAVTSATIANGAVGAPQIAVGSITTPLVAPGAITSQLIGPGTITTSNLADGAVTLGKFAVRQVGTNVDVGGLAISASSGAAVNGTPGVDIANLSVTLVTSGRPVFVGLIADGSATDDSYLESSQGYNETDFKVGFTRDSVIISRQFAGVEFSAGPFAIWYIPPTAIQHIDTPPPGKHTYTFRTIGFQSKFLVHNVKLIAYEL